MPVHLTLFVLRSLPSNKTSSLEVSFHFVSISRRLVKKSFVSVPGFFVNTPCFELSKFVPRTRIPPTRTVISGAVSFINCARSTNISSDVTVGLFDDPFDLFTI